MPTKKAARRTGIRAARRRAAHKLIRDRKIYRILRWQRYLSIRRHHLLRATIEPLSVYAGISGHVREKDLTLFPLTKQRDGTPMPPWTELSPWLKAQVLVMTLTEWGLQTFSIHLHPDLEASWLAVGRDPRVEIRDRFRKELEKTLGKKREYFFVVEGWSPHSKRQVGLHIHGGIFIAEQGDGDLGVDAAARACGHGIQGYRKIARAVHQKVYWKDGPKYIDYLLKSVRRPDHRLQRGRLHISREATGAGREMWGLMTEPR